MSSLEAYGHEIETKQAGPNTYKECRHCKATSMGKQNTLCPEARMVSVEVMRLEVRQAVERLGEGKSGSKIMKKVNRLYKRGIKKTIDQEVEIRLEAFNRMVKPKPTWIPGKAWEWIKGIVLKESIEV